MKNVYAGTVGEGAKSAVRRRNFSRREHRAVSLLHSHRSHYHDLKRILGFQNVPYLVADKEGNIVYQHTGYVEGDEFELEEQLKLIAAK